jgi:hypothetical protein
MEDSMCWEMDYRWLAEQKKAEDAKAKQEQRAEAIEKLLPNRKTATKRCRPRRPFRRSSAGCYPLVTTGHSRSRNGVAPLAYAGGPCCGAAP